jgi:hypothetical protein
VTNDPDRAKRLGHWQAIADQLGLSDDKPTPPTSKSAAPKPEPAAPRSWADEAPAAREEIRESAGVPPQVERPAAAKAVEGDREDREGEGPDRETRSAGRRRRRRGPRRDSNEPGARVESEEETGPEPAGFREADRPGSRDEAPEAGFRDEDADEEEDEGGDDSAGPEEGPGPWREEDDTDEETVDYSTWSVPSWNEIIAGLYRPER